MAAGFWNADFPAEHDFPGGEFLAIYVGGGVIVGAKRGALKRNAGKKTARTRVAENLSAHVGIGGCGSVAAYRTRGDRGVSAQLDFAPENRIGASFVHNEQNEV